MKLADQITDFVNAAFTGLWCKRRKPVRRIASGILVGTALARTLKPVICTPQSGKWVILAEIKSSSRHRRGGLLSSNFEP
jgi:hypothetical protein